jgi:hypothetical protein
MRAWSIADLSTAVILACVELRLSGADFAIDKRRATEIPFGAMSGTKASDSTS